jgi:DNA-binding PadR family transcriptional regulator
MARQKKEKVDRDFSYQDIIDRLGENEDVSFERIGDTIIMKREEPEEIKIQEEVSQATEYETGPVPGNVEANLEDAEKKLFLVKKEIEKKRIRRISRKDSEELEVAFSRVEERLDSLEREFRSLRVEFGYLRGVTLEKLRLASSEEPTAEKAEYPKMAEVAANKDGSQVQLLRDDIPEMKFEEKKNGGRLGFLTSTLSNIYNSFFLGAGEERDVYKEFQKKLFFLVRTQPRSLDDIAEGTGESRADCLIWLTRMVDEGLLAEMKEQGAEGKRVYRIVWEKIA